jgi:hypothetical protein
MVEEQVDNRYWYDKLNRKQKLDLRQSLIDGVPLYIIARVYGVSQAAISNRYSDLLERLAQKVPGRNAEIGYKNEPYYVEEEEMLTTPKYSYQELSETEKQIYDGRENNTLE